MFSCQIHNLASKSTIICLLDGYARQNYDHDWEKIQVEQVIEYSDYVQSFDYRYLTETPVDPSLIVSSGIKTGWLKYNTSVTEEKIIISTTEVDKSKEDVYGNCSIHWFHYNITVNRLTGISVYDVSTSMTCSGTTYTHELKTSGSCNVAQRKF